MPASNGIHLNLTTHIEDHCKKLFRLYPDPKLTYHNLHHTQFVVRRALEIAANYDLTEQELFILFAAAWFHDTGHLKHSHDGHEIKSVHIMFDFFLKLDLNLLMIKKISACILATKYPCHPQTLVEMIVCDADFYHLGTDEFLTSNELVKAEIEMRQNIKIPDWNKTSLLFLKKHSYFTGYCKKKLDAGKNYNILQIQNLISA